MRAISIGGGEDQLLAVAIDEPTFNAATIDLIVLRKRRLPRVLQAFVEALISEIGASAPLRTSDVADRATGANAI